MTWKYSEFVFRLVEKTGCAVAVKYLLPGEELDPDSLITVSDDDDLQVCLSFNARLPTASFTSYEVFPMVISKGLAAIVLIGVGVACKSTTCWYEYHHSC